MFIVHFAGPKDVVRAGAYMSLEADLNFKRFCQVENLVSDRERIARRNADALMLREFGKVRE